MEKHDKTLIASEKEDGGKTKEAGNNYMNLRILKPDLDVMFEDCAGSSI